MGSELWISYRDDPRREPAWQWILEEFDGVETGLSEYEVEAAYTTTWTFGDARARLWGSLAPRTERLSHRHAPAWAEHFVRFEAGGNCFSEWLLHAAVLRLIDLTENVNFEVHDPQLEETIVGREFLLMLAAKRLLRDLRRLRRAGFANEDGPVFDAIEWREHPRPRIVVIR